MNGQQINDKGSFGKYFTVLLNMCDDDLDPYQYRLMGHYRRVCGEGGYCNEAIETTAAKCKMSLSKARSTRSELKSMGYIEYDEKAKGKSLVITITDRTEENILRYAKATKSDSLAPITEEPKATKSSSVGEGTPTKSDRSPLPDLIPKEEPYKKNHKEESAKRPRDKLFDLVLLRSFASNPKNKSSGKLYGGRVGPITSALKAQFKIGPEQEAAFRRELRLAYRWHAKQKDEAGVPLRPCQAAVAVVEMVKRYRRAVPLQTPVKEGEPHWYEKEIEPGMWKMVYERTA